MTQGRVYRIRFQRTAERELAALGTRDRARIAIRIDALAEDPEDILESRGLGTNENLGFVGGTFGIQLAR